MPTTSVAFLDVSAGVAGDMCLGALVDAGLPLSALEDVVAALGLDGVRLAARRVTKGALAATKVDVLLPGAPTPAPEAFGHGHGPAHGGGHGHAHAHPHAHDHAHPHDPAPGAGPGASAAPHPWVHGPGPAHGHEHRTLRDVLAILRAARGLPAEGVADAVRAFTWLAQAEGRVHGIAPEEVHFHEVGALDAIVDIVGTCVGLRRLGVLEVRTTALPWSSGRARMAHGAMALPAPATVHLMEGHPTYPSGESFEQVTPTGAALVRALSRGILPPAGFVPRATGVGAGDHPGGALPNVVRLVLGEVGGDATPADATLLETNLDDATGQQVGHAIERAMAEGALDAWAVPATMKKSRPGVVLSVLCEPARAADFEALLFRETPTLGVRRRAVARTVLARRTVAVKTPYGPVHLKVRTTPSGDEATPEYEECRLAAERAGVPWREVSAAALRAFDATRGG
ncbi:MAG: LarC family nickel insertion protein [Planctomycetes bacterium]|nr:LarC family nickel insertion protein [Planctomycetota bacterium]